MVICALHCSGAYPTEWLLGAVEVAMFCAQALSSGAMSCGSPSRTTNVLPTVNDAISWPDGRVPRVTDSDPTVSCVVTVPEGNIVIPECIERSVINRGLPLGP